MITKRELKKELEFFKDLCKRLENEKAEQKKKHFPGAECKGRKNIILHMTPLMKPEFYCKLDRTCNDFEETERGENGFGSSGK